MTFKKLRSMFRKKEPEVTAQGLFDIFGMFDAETVDKIKAILASIDPDKIKLIMDSVAVDENGWIRIQVDLGIKKVALRSDLSDK